MTQRRSLFLALLATSVGAGALLALALVHGAPHVGFDFCYFLPRLVDVYLHQRVEGVWAIQWWTPSFGGGIPAFFNPQHTQFMLAQGLTPWLGPWGAAVAQAALFNAFGSAMVVWVCARRLGYALAPSVLAGLTFATCGFMWEHTLVGHMSFNVFPLVAIVPEALHRSVPAMRSIAWLGLGAAAIIFGGGYTVVIVFALTCLLLACMLPLCWPEAYGFPTIIRRLAFGAAAAAAGAALKVISVLLFLSSFPRLVDYRYEGLSFLAAPSLLWQLFGQRAFLGFTRWLPFTGTEQQPWFGRGEDVGYGLVTLGILAGGAALLSRRQKKSPQVLFRWPLVSALVAAVWLTGEFALGRGVLWPMLKPLPFLRSLHENHRLAGAFALPLALCVAPCWSALMAGRRQRLLEAATVVAAIGTLASVDPFFRAHTGFWFGAYDLSPIQTTWDQLRADPHENFPITRISDLHDDSTFLAHASSWKPYEPIFGYGHGGSEFRTLLSPGPIERIAEPPAAWRFHDPRRFIMPGLASSDRFSPWADAPEGELRQFLRRHQPAWPLPWAVRAGAVLSSVTLLALVAGALWSLLRASPRQTPQPSAGGAA